MWCAGAGKQFTDSSDVCPSAAGRTDSTKQLAFALTGTLDKQNQFRRGRFVAAISGWYLT